MSGSQKAPSRAEDRELVNFQTNTMSEVMDKSFRSGLIAAIVKKVDGLLVDCASGNSPFQGCCSMILGIPHSIIHFRDVR
jgi:hypothetical protein